MLVCSMALDVSAPGRRLRIVCSRWLGRLGFGEDSFLLVLAVFIGVITGAAAVGFHELINLIRDLLYKETGGQAFLYGRGAWLLVAWPAAGGLAVGCLGRWVFRAREGHGIVDVVESVVRSSGFQKPVVAVEKIVTSAVTIGSGGSAGAEGPIVQIGAAIASGVGQLFNVTRTQMPLLTGCGCAAGISAIFSAPFGGVLFTLEVILQDFSIRTFTPVVLASVIAQVTTLGILQTVHKTGPVATAIFAMPSISVEHHTYLQWDQIGNFMLLGLVCAVCGICLTRMMPMTEHIFDRVKLPRFLRPALGGTILGCMGLAYIYVFGHLLLRVPGNKPFPYADYPMPAFFGDGYGAVQKLFDPAFFTGYQWTPVALFALLGFLCIAKIVGTCLTLGSGGSGGIIAPSVFIGATAGSIVGFLLKHWLPHSDVQPELYALVGMGAVLSAVVHAPLASILICFELTQDYKVMLPAMLACIISTGIARALHRDSIYTAGLRARGVRLGDKSDLTLLRRMTVEQVDLEPAVIVHHTEPLRRALDLAESAEAPDIVIADEQGRYMGMIVADDIKAALLAPEAIPLLMAEELMRVDVPMVRNTDDLATVLDTFSRCDVGRLPVKMQSAPDRVIGLISRAGLMKRYQQGLDEPT